MRIQRCVIVHLRSFQAVDPLPQASRGRTYDQPVDGFVVRNGSVYYYVHTDVPGVSRQWNPKSRLTRYKLNAEALERLTRTAHLTLPGCAESKRRTGRQERQDRQEMKKKG